MRKLLGVLVAGLALASGGLGSRRVDVARDKAIRAEAGRAAEGAAQRAAEGLSALLSDLKLKGDNAAANPRLVFALQGNVDARTMRDLWRTEEWWRPWRSEFKVYAVAVTGTRLDATEGIDAADLDAASLLRSARDRSDTVAEIILGKGLPFAATATVVKVPGRDQSPLLLLAKPVDPPLLRKLSEKAGGAVILTDGRRPLVAAGAQTEQTLLAGAVGSEAAERLFHAADGTWAAAANRVSTGLWLWTFAAAAAAAHDAAAAASERKVMLWAVAVLLAGAALVFGLRRPRADPGTTTVPASNSTQWDATGMPHGPPPPQTLRGQGPTPRTPRSDVVDASSATALAPAVSSPTTGPKDAPFGRYTLLDRLGEGGMAEVYTAVTFGAEGFRRKFVIKRLRAELAREPAAVDQFIDEANLASSMVHSNIVPVFDFGKVGEEYFLAQEYILGRDLSRLTKRSMERDARPLSAEVTLYAAHETLKALEYAHTKTSEDGHALDIVHRDVSPTNVIVSSRGEVKLFDFGIVKAEGRVTKTQSGVVKGNVSFMSPEQARGTEVDARADLFSLGLVVFYCLTGQVLYSGGTTYELLVKAATGPGPDELARLAAMPPPWDAILRRALQVNPTQRFASAREFGEAIAPHIGAGAAQLAALMNRLFAEDFKNEEARFRRYESTESSPDAASSSGAQGTMPRRT